MFIYVSGPYSAPASMERHEAAERVEANIAKANEAAMTLVRKGHFPFVPHTMMRGWEDRHGVPRHVALGVCLAWVARCDCMLLLGSSPGADAEHKVAVQHGLQVFRAIEEVPAAGTEQLGDVEG